jgi:hypothetical protein
VRGRVTPGADLDHLGSEISHLAEGVLAQCGAQLVPTVLGCNRQKGDTSVLASRVDVPGHVAGDGVVGLGDRYEFLLLYTAGSPRSSPL